MRHDVIRPPLRGEFTRTHNEKIHELEPGNSTLLGYPNSVYGHSVFLLTSLSVESKDFTALQINGNMCARLSAIGKDQLGMDIAPEDDLPVFTGGPIAGNQMFILTPHDWHPEMSEWVAGPYRIHNQLPALRALMTGDRPERVRLFCGMFGGEIGEFEAALQDNQIGEITTPEDILFGNYEPETQWLRAMHLHTGGGALCIPVPYQARSLIAPGKDRQNGDSPRFYIH